MELLPDSYRKTSPMSGRLPRARADVRVVTSFGATGLDERTWNALATRGRNSVFQTYQWQRSWWEVYGGRYEPIFVRVSDGHATRGLAALFVDKNATGNRVVRFVGHGRADYCDILAGDEPQTVAAIVKGLRDYQHWDVLELGSIPSESPTVAILRACCEQLGLSVMVHDQFICPTLLVRGHESAARRIVEKASLRRRQNYFERVGRLDFSDLRTARDVAPLLDTFFDQHAARWRDSSSPSLFSEPANRAFYREVVARLDGTRWLLFSSISLDDQPIAFHFGFHYNESLLWYKPSFDPAFAAHSPGLVMIRHLVRRVLDDGLRELDFTIGDEAFKRRFTNVIRKTVKVQIFRNQALYAYERSRLGVRAAVRRAAGTILPRP